MTQANAAADTQQDIFPPKELEPGLPKRRIPVTGISTEEYNLVCRLKRERVARPTKRILADDPLVMSVGLTCGDGTRLPHAMKFHRDGVGEPFYPLTIVGGGPGFHPDSPFNDGSVFPLEHYLEQIRRAAKAMNTKKLGVFAHAPCGGAKAFQVSMPQQIELNFMTLVLLERHLEEDGFELCSYLHIVHGEPNFYGERRFDETFDLHLTTWLEKRSGYPEVGELKVQLPQIL